MSWSSRIKVGAYIAPSGKRIEFSFEDVSVNFDKKTTGFEFTGANGTYVQDNGSTGNKYPVTAIFYGPDCDLEADDFMEALAETGRGRLEHPFYKTADVVPYGTVTRTDALKTAANQTLVEVTFWETIPLIYPIPQVDPESQVLGGVSDLSSDLGDSVSDSLFGMSSAGIGEFKARATAMVESVREVIGKATDIRDDVNARISGIKRQIEEITSPVIETEKLFRYSIGNMVDNLVDLMSTPSSIESSIKDKVNDYKRMIDTVKRTADPKGSESNYVADNMMCESILAGLIVNATTTEFETQGEALETANEVLEIFDDLNAWQDEERDKAGVIDANQTYSTMLSTTSITAGYLVELSFSLKKERRIKLTRSRSLIDLTAELYGSVDDKLDYFISSNSLSGAEIIEIPKGREVVYYV